MKPGDSIKIDKVSNGFIVMAAPAFPERGVMCSAENYRVFETLKGLNDFLTLHFADPKK